MTVSRLGPGGYPKELYGSFAGRHTAIFLHLTDTIDNLHMPINCVVAGQQKEPVKKAMGLTGAISGPLRGIFGE